jgi:hypothetical protein
MANFLVLIPGVAVTESSASSLRLLYVCPLCGRNHHQHHEDAAVLPGTNAHPNKGDQKENKPRVLPHLLFYRNICLGLIVGTDNHMYLLCTVVLLVAYLLKNLLLIT